VPCLPFFFLVLFHVCAVELNSRKKGETYKRTCKLLHRGRIDVKDATYQPHHRLTARGQVRLGHDMKKIAFRKGSIKKYEGSSSHVSGYRTFVRCLPLCIIDSRRLSTDLVPQQHNPGHGRFRQHLLGGRLFDRVYHRLLRLA